MRISVLFFLLVGFCAAKDNKNCHEKPLEYREEEANVIFTGTVRGVFQDWKHPDMQKAQVEVKRIIKGDNVINSLPGVNPYKPWMRKVVMVDGIGDPHICHSSARRYDSRIFLLNKDKSGELKLNSSLVRLTLTNLEIADAAVKDKEFVTPPPEVLAPCDRVYCAFGARCRVDKDTNEGKCECEEKCSDTFTPVCGSDGATYTNECQLRATSCAAQKRIKVKWQGACNVKDPCAEKRCSFGASCVPSLDGLAARCVCPQQCNTYGDSVGSKPVCGDDGNDYANECQMRQAACNQMKDITIKYTGPCDPCKDVVCDGQQVCQLDELRRPVCRCNQLCTFDISPVCASDGHTYSNRCIMEVEACKKRIALRVLFDTECSQGSNPCSSVSCLAEEECHVDRQGVARCSCPPQC